MGNFSSRRVRAAEVDDLDALEAAVLDQGSAKIRVLKEDVNSTRDEIRRRLEGVSVLIRVGKEDGNGMKPVTVELKRAS